MSVKLLFAKLGHSLEEIRVRSLQNIVSKLDHDVICESDLVQEKHLHIRLLEWFNFPSCVMQDKVLSLILRLSKHAAAAEIYVDIGGVEFLSQLRPNTDPSLHYLIDSILDNLFHLPVVSADDHTGQHECIYRHRQSLNAASTVELVYGLETGSNSSVLTDLSHQYISTQHPSTLYQHSSSGTQYGSATARYSTQHVNGGGGYFAGVGQEMTTGRELLPVTVAAKFLKFATFPWVALTPTDRHVLSSTDDSVRSRDVSMVVSVCEFLMDVVFQDFPAEVFLQRPSIVKNLLLLVDPVSPRSVLLSAVQTLNDFAANLASRIRFHQDPCFHIARQVSTSSPDCSALTTATQSFNSSVEAPATTAAFIGQARHRGDGQDVDNTTGSSDTLSGGSPMAANLDMIEQTDLEEVFSLQFVQWTVPQFSFQVLEKVVSCLQGTVDDQLSMQCFELIHQVSGLLTVSLIPSALWEDDSLPAHELIYGFHELLDSLGKALYAHHHANLSPIMPNVELQRHRVVFIGLAAFTVHLLDVLVPRHLVSVALPREFVTVLLTMVLDGTLAAEFPHIASKSLELATELDAEACSVCGLLTLACQSQTSTCHFLTALQQQLLSEENCLSLIQLAEQSLPSLQYHVCLDVVNACVTLASFVCKKSSSSSGLMQQSRDILLTVMSHDVEAVRLGGYRSIYTIINEALGIELAAEPTSSSTLAAMFLVDAKVLYQLCCFGMDDVEEICNISEEILCYLLQSQLLMPAAGWQQLIDALSPVHAVLQSCCDPSSSLGWCIIRLLETDPRIDSGTMSLLERFRGCLRLFFHSNATVRESGAERSLKLLSIEESSSAKLPSISDINLRSLHDIFIIRSPRTLSTDSRPSVCQVSDVQKVFEIFTSEGVEITVRRSAVDQLCTILTTDVSLHSAFIQIGGLTSVVNTIKSAVRIPSDAVVPRNSLVMLLPPLIKLLRSLVERDCSLRHRFAHEIGVYYALFRCGLIYQKDEDLRRDLSELLALLLFDEMAAMQEWTSSRILQPERVPFSLPSCIVRRYHLPFVTATHHTRSPWAGKTHKDQPQLLSGLPAEALRIAWNVAWYDGIEEAIASKNTASDRYHERMWLTATDQLIMSATHLPFALRQCVYDVNNATSHAAVSQALCRLSWYLTVSKPISEVAKHFNVVPWKAAIARFLTVAPSTVADEQLVLDIVKFLTAVIRCCSAAAMEDSSGCAVDDTFSWIGEMLLNKNGALYHLLNKTDLSAESTGNAPTRLVGRHLLRFVHLFICRLPYHLTSERCSGAGLVSGPLGRIGTSQLVSGDLVRCVFTKVNKVDSVQSYNLPSLELTLITLMHITARRGWSVTCSSADCLTLCLEMLQTLLEVVSAFHAGRGGLLMSYMGRGITRSASVCLRHLAHEMATNLHSQEWPRNWLFGKSVAVDSVGESGLHWLFSLWTYRDIEVRVAGVSIAAALTATQSGRITMASQCHNVPGGIWGAAFGLLLDPTESSAVRQQAALLLVNLTSESLPSSGDVQTDTVIWQGPVVRNEESQVSLVGLPALLVLLQHLEFFAKIYGLISSLYVQPSVHPITSLAQVSSAPNDNSSQMTVTTTVSMTPSVSTGLLVDLSGSAQAESRLQTSSLSGQGHDSENNVVRRRHVTGEGHNGDSLTLNIDAAVTGDRSMSSASETTHLSSSSMSSAGHSVVTPGLVSSVCTLLSNLLVLSPRDVSTSVRSHAVLQALVKTLEDHQLTSSQPTDNQSMLFFTDTLAMYHHILSLITSLSITDTESRGILFNNQAAVNSVVSLLAVAHQDDLDAESCCKLLWKSVFDMVSALLQSVGLDAYTAFTSSLVKQWKLVSSRMLYVIQETSCSDSDLHLSVMNFMALLFAEEVKFKFKLQGRRGNLDFPFFSDCLDETSGSTCEELSGSQLCRALVKCFDAVLLKPQDQQQFFIMKATVFNALKSLLALSASAKTCALELGLLETLCEHVRHLHNILSMDALDLSKLPPSSKKKANPTLTELIMTFDLLRNFLFDSDEVKNCASKSSLANLIHSLWCWCLSNVNLMSSTLALLSAYTAHCPPACSSLACTTASALLPVTTTSSLGNKLSHNNSLCHCVVRLIQKETSNLSPASDANSSTTVLKPAFHLAATLTVSPECRGIMWKSNFLHGFSTLSPQKTKKTKSASTQPDGLWLALFVNLSFSAEGQNMILKIDDALSLLIDYASAAHESYERQSLLILRNLCFHAANKPKLLSNDKLLPLFLRHLDSSPGYTQTVACSAILALAYNNHKAKGILKGGNIVRRLRDAYNRCAVHTDADSVGSCSQIIRDILCLLT